MGLLLMTEDNFKDVNSGSRIIEEATGKKEYFIEGVYLQAEDKNRNGRVYPRAILEREVARYTKDYIDNGRAMGELNHPQDPSVNPDRACHLIQKLVQEGNNWIGKSKVLSTPKGMLVRSLLDDGVQLGVSSRGLGTLSEGADHKIVNEDYYMTCVDMVSDPSAPKAWVNGIYEGKEYYMGDDHEFIEKVKREIDNEASKKGFSMVEEYIVLEKFNQLMARI